MLGHYENFPQQVHAVASFDYQESAKDVQKAILCAFHRLNNEICDLGAITPYVTQKCEVGFEFGVAEDFDFNFLDQEELDRCLKFVDENEVQMLDFFVVVRYHIVKEDGKRVPLRFDYHVLRFVFQESKLEMRIRHERGSQRVTPNDLTAFITKKINAELAQRQLTPLLSGVFEKADII
ncbi:MAG: hypothetical protein CW716_01125 [Candidatus Bathyarchaeum sp.]|nr:MAG: hypothetical protein CW716_01125 [Candidatus Bathyarchaeum sp.]